MVIALSSPIKIGIYENNILIDSFESIQKTTEILPIFFNKILEKYKINTLFFTNGPGSFMAIKATYIFLRTLSITQNIPLLATDGFAFNNNKPIKAIGTLYFIKKDGIIFAQKINAENKELNLDLPHNLDREIFHTNTEPLYILPAV